MNTIEQSPTGQGYKSLAELRMRKKILLKDIQKDDEQIKELWDNLFHKRCQICLLSGKSLISRTNL